MGSSKFPTKERVEDQADRREAVEEPRLNDATVTREESNMMPTDTIVRQTVKSGIMKRIALRVNRLNTRKRVRRVRILPIQVRNE